jgi:hypothetical protein
MNKYISVIAILFTALLNAACSQQKTEPKADSIYTGGDIVTLNDQQPTAEAVAVKAGKIIAVGKRKLIEAQFKSANTVIVDLAGQTLMPGFIDPHSHYYNSLLVANQAQVYAPPSGPGKDIDSIINTIKTFATDNKVAKGELIMAYGYDDTVMPNNRLLNRDDLDAAFPDNPVRVDHVSMHGTVMNSLALKKYGYDENTVTPPGGVIVRKEGTNEPYGLIMESAFLQTLALSEPMTPAQEIAATKAGQMLYAENGITTAHEGATHLDQYQVIKRASDAGVNIIDLIAYPFITDVDKVLEVLPLDQWGKYVNRLKVGGVKVTIDGSPQGRTARFTTPYLQGGPAGEDNWQGELTFPQDIVNKMVKKVYDMGVPLNLHANGDGGIDAFFTAHELAASSDLEKQRDITMIHAQFARRDQLNKFVQYKVRPSFYTLHTYYFAEAHLSNRGKAQTDYISPMRDAIDIGLRPTNHTDFVVAPLDQMMVLWSAVNRISRAGAVIGADQSVSVLEGLKTMTIWSAEQYGEQASKGSLEVGKLADMVILSANPLNVEAMTIKDIKVVETIKEGQSIYRAN